LPNLYAWIPQISHAGDGGIYAEMISDRSFGGLAYSLGLAYREATHLAVPASCFEHDYLPFSPAVGSSNLTNAHLLGTQRWASATPFEYRYCLIRTAQHSNNAEKPVLSTAATFC